MPLLISWVSGQVQLSWLSSVPRMGILNHCGLEPSRNCEAAFTETNSAHLAGGEGSGVICMCRAGV